VANEVAELKLKLAEATALSERLQTEVLWLRAALSRVQNATRAGTNREAAGKHDILTDPRLVTVPPVAPPPAASLRAGRGSDPISQTPDTQTPAAQSPSSRRSAGRQRKPSLRSGGLIFAASPTGNKVIAHNALTQKEQSILLSANTENPIDVSFLAFGEVVGLDLQGTRITRTAVYHHRTGTWVPLELSEPVSGELHPALAGEGAVAYDTGRHFYTFSTQTGKWDHFDLGTITNTQERP
jgi:hypothetical protein